MRETIMEPSSGHFFRFWMKLNLLEIVNNSSTINRIHFENSKKNRLLKN